MQQVVGCFDVVCAMPPRVVSPEVLGQGGLDALIASLQGALGSGFILDVLHIGVRVWQLSLCRHKYVCTCLWVCTVLCGVVVVLVWCGGCATPGCVMYESHSLCAEIEAGVCRSFVLVPCVSRGTVCYPGIRGVSVVSVQSSCLCSACVPVGGQCCLMWGTQCWGCARSCVRVLGLQVVAFSKGGEEVLQHELHTRLELRLFVCTR